MFVTQYNVYPIFEPAEGGYYYEGRSPVESRRFTNKGRAIKYLEKLAREQAKDCGVEVNGQLRCTRDYRVTLFKNSLRVGTGYHGEGEEWIIENRPYSNQSGWHLYE